MELKGETALLPSVFPLYWLDSVPEICTREAPLTGSLALKPGL